MRQGRAKGNFPLRGPVSLIYCYLSKHCKKLGKSGKLFQIRITYDLLATCDKVAECLTLKKSIRKKGEIGNLLENLVLGSKLLYVSLMSCMGSLFGLAYGRSSDGNRYGTSRRKVSPSSTARSL